MGIMRSYSCKTRIGMAKDKRFKTIVLAIISHRRQGKTDPDLAFDFGDVGLLEDLSAKTAILLKKIGLKFLRLLSIE